MCRGNYLPSLKSAPISPCWLCHEHSISMSQWETLAPRIKGTSISSLFHLFPTISNVKSCYLFFLLKWALFLCLISPFLLLHYYCTSRYCISQCKLLPMTSASVPFGPSTALLDDSSWSCYFIISLPCSKLIFFWPEIFLNSRLTFTITCWNVYKDIFRTLKSHFFKPKSFSLLPHPGLHHQAAAPPPPIQVSVHHQALPVITLELSLFSTWLLSHIPKFNRSQKHVDSLATALICVLANSISCHFSFFNLSASQFTLHNAYRIIFPNDMIIMSPAQHILYFPSSKVQECLVYTVGTLLSCPIPTWHLVFKNIPLNTLCPILLYYGCHI